MDLSFLLRGMVIGVSIAAPVGPISLLLIRRTLALGRLTGFVSGLGVATADGLYGSLAAFGLTAVSSMLIGLSPWLRLVGGIFLIYLGIRTLRAKPATQEATTKATTNGLIGAYSSILLLTLTNPATIIAFTGVFAGLGIADLGNTRLATALLVLGVLGGSALWQSTVIVIAGLFRSRLTPGRLVWVNRVYRVMIAGFGAVVLWSLLMRGAGV